MIPENEYRIVIKSVPIICVDVILEHPEKGYLLVRRNNEPLKDDYWVVGGRVLKSETLKDAAIRKVRQELGFTTKNLDFVGVYEDFFDKNSLQLDSLYHTVSAVFHAALQNQDDFQLDSQSSSWMFSDKLPARLKILTSEKSLTKKAGL